MHPGDPRRVTIRDYDDAWPLDAKLAFVLDVAQPFPRAPGAQRGDPRFPFEAVPTRAAARRHIEAAAVQAFAMWDVNVTPAPGRPGAWRRLPPQRSPMARASPPGHAPESVAAWRDIWTHPEVYRRVFADWMPPVYASRAATEALSDRAADASRRRRPPPAVPSPTGSLYRNPARGPADPGALAPYEHPPPERMGHRTRLAHHSAAPLALARREEIRAIVGEADLEFPHWVARLEDPGWYIGGFLPSVLLWAHWAFRARDAAAPLEPGRPTEISVLAAIRDPVGELGAELGAAWQHLHGLLHYGRFAPRVPLPDLIRVPQELLAAAGGLDASPGAPPYELHVAGVSGEDRRRIEKRPLTRHDLGAPEWLEALSAHAYAELYAGATDTSLWDYDPAPARRAPATKVREVGLITRYLEEMGALHAQVVAEEGDTPRLSPPERYVPHRHPPNPHAALFLPWTVLAPAPAPADAPDAPSAPGLFVERVAALPALANLVLSNVALPCLETGLAIEEWGRCWSGAQRAAPPLPAQRGVIEALGYGLPVPAWEDPPARALVLQHILVLDPAVLSAEGEARGEAERAARAWFRPERLRTAESLTLYGPPLDASGRWEDSGIEMPPRLERPPGAARPLRFLKAQHNAVPFDARRIARIWALFDRRRARETGGDAGALRPADKAVHRQLHLRAERRAEARRWRLAAVDPWPVHFSAHWADLRPLEGAALSRAPVLRELSFAHATLPYAQWLTDLLAAPPGAAAAPLDAGVGYGEWLERNGIGAGAYACLHPTARVTLQWLGVDRNATLRRAPRAAHRIALPGVLPPLRPPALRAAPSAFRHYPNLALISLHRNGLVDVPPGLLDLVFSTRRTPPLAPPEGYGVSAAAAAVVWPDRVPPIACDLSDNAIAGVSDQALGGLLYLLKYELLLRRPIRFWINVSGNPVAGLLEYERRTRRELQDHLDDMKRLVTGRTPAHPSLTASHVHAMERFVLAAERQLAERGRSALGAVVEDLGVELAQGGGLWGAEALEAAPQLGAIRERFRGTLEAHERDRAARARLMGRIEAEWDSDQVLRAHPKGLPYIKKRVLGFFDVRKPDAFHGRMMEWKNAPQRWFF